MGNLDAIRSRPNPAKLEPSILIRYRLQAKPGNSHVGVAQRHVVNAVDNYSTQRRELSLRQ